MRLGAQRSGLFKSRPHLTAAILAGWATAAVLSFMPNEFAWSRRAILSWDAAWIVFVVASLWTMRGETPAAIRKRAASQDEGQGLILGLVLLAAAVSLGAIGAELSAAKGAGVEAAARAALVFATVAGSWFTVQLIFALHYSHEYYASDEGKDRGGLIFPGGDEPDYWDFLHFSVVIGVASQTADIAFSSQSLRRIGTLHSVVAFVFNTVVLALAITFLAGLFSG